MDLQWRHQSLARCVLLPLPGNVTCGRYRGSLADKDSETEPSLIEIKGILHNIQQSISSILKDNKSLKEDPAHLKSSFGSQVQEIKKLNESLETYKNENTALKNELETNKQSLAKQIDELGNMYDQLDELEQYSRKNSIEIYGILEGSYNSTEERTTYVHLIGMITLFFCERWQKQYRNCPLVSVRLKLSVLFKVRYCSSLKQVVSLN